MGKIKMRNSAIYYKLIIFSLLVMIPGYAILFAASGADNSLAITARGLLRKIDREFKGKQLIGISLKRFSDLESCSQSRFSTEFQRTLQKELARSIYAFRSGETADLTGTYSLKSGSNLVLNVELVDRQTNRRILATEFSANVKSVDPSWFRISPHRFVESMTGCLFRRLTRPLLRLDPSSKLKIYVNEFKNTDAQLKSGFAGLLKRRLQEAILTAEAFELDDTGLKLTGSFSADKNIHLHAVIADRSGKTLSTANFRVAKHVLDREWFEVGLEDHLNAMVNEIAAELKGNEIVLSLNDIKYRDTKAGSQLGRFLSGNIAVLLGSHRRFKVVKYTETKKIVGTTNHRGLRKTIKPEDEITRQIGAEYYLNGAYWDLNNKEIQLSLTLHDPDHSIVAGTKKKIEIKLFPQHLQIEPENIAPATIAKAGKTKPESSEIKSFEVSLQTSRGDGGTYFEGESFSIFFSANSSCFTRIFYQQSDGLLLQIFPQEDSYDFKTEADKIYSIPDPSLNYEFQVSSPFGFEEVHAIASIMPMKKTPGKRGESGLIEYSGTFDELLNNLLPGSQNDRKFISKSIMITTIPK